MPKPIPSQILHSSLEPEPPHGHDNMQDRAAFGKEGLKAFVFHKRDHEQQEPNREQEQTRERIGCPDQQLIVRGGAQEFRGGLDPVGEGVDSLHVEHHERAA